MSSLSKGPAASDMWRDQQLWSGRDRGPGRGLGASAAASLTGIGRAVALVQVACMCRGDECGEEAEQGRSALEERHGDH